MNQLEGRKILVTGSSRGIGAATAKLLASKGASIIVNYVKNEEAAQKVVEDIQQKGGHATLVQADVTDEAQVTRMFSEIKKSVGDIDTMVLNAGLSFPIAPFVEYPWEAFETKLMGEIKAAFYSCKAAVPSMIEKKNGCIVAISSGLSRHPGFGFCAHSTAKSALDAFVKSLALELGPMGIRVNVVAPGLTLTDATAFMPEENKKMAAKTTPLQRVAKPEDIAGAVLLMVLNESGFITGNYLPVNGGSQMV